VPWSLSGDKIQRRCGGYVSSCVGLRCCEKVCLEFVTKSQQTASSANVDRQQVPDIRCGHSATLNARWMPVLHVKHISYRRTVRYGTVWVALCQTWKALYCVNVRMYWCVYCTGEIWLDDVHRWRRQGNCSLWIWCHRHRHWLAFWSDRPPCLCFHLLCFIFSTQSTFRQVKCPTHPLHYMLPPARFHFSDDIKADLPLFSSKV